MKHFTDLADLSDYTKYKARLRKVLPKIKQKPERFRYFDEYDFGSAGKHPLLIVGDLDPKLAKEIESKGKRPAHGRCSRTDQTGLELAVRTGKVEPSRVQKCLRAAGYEVPLEVRDMAAQELEVESLADAGAVGAGLEAHGAALEAHLKARTTPGAHEVAAQEILEMGERAANAGKAPDAPRAHAVSAHGPETDQIPRLVSGRRADQVAEERAAGTAPPGQVVLQNNPVISDATVPQWTTVGDDPSPVSSRFRSAADMLLAIEEALSQAMRLQSHVAAEMKAAKDEKELLQAPEVKAALEGLVAARRSADQARAALEEARAKRARDVTQRLESVEQQNKAFESASARFQAALGAARGQRPPLDPSQLAEGRLGRSVRPGVPVGESFEVEGAPAFGDGPLTPGEMQARFEKVRHKGTLEEAKVILDPAHVTGPDGVKRRAGWQVQTAFPTSENEAKSGLSKAEYDHLRAKERFDKAEGVRKQAEEQRNQLNAERRSKKKELDDAKLQVEKEEQAVIEAENEAERKAAEVRLERATADVEERKALLKQHDEKVARIDDVFARARDAATAARAEVEKARLAAEG